MSKDTRRGDQTLIGDDALNILIGGRGDDEVFGLGGADLLIGGRGDDDLFGGDGADVLKGRRGDDRLEGGDGGDLLKGGRGDDVLLGDAGDDVINGGRGDDTIIWNNGDGSDRINGGRGYDEVVVNSGGADDLFEIETQGRRGLEVERETAGRFELDIRNVERIELNTGAGDDAVDLEQDVLDRVELALDGGADTADAQPAISSADIATGDTIDLSEFEQGVRVDLDENNQGVLQGDVIVDGVNISDTTLPGLSEFGNVQIDGEVVVDALDDFENVIGTDFNDTIFGNAQNNVLLGGDGDDALHPFGGEDYVNGGGGRDVLLLNGFANGQFVDMAGGVAGDLNAAGDGIADGAALNRFANIENINGSSVAGDVILGDGEANVLNGLGGNDAIDGGAGGDVLIGGAGDNDVLTGGAGDDSFVFANGDGNGAPNNADQIQDFTVGHDRFALDAASFGLDADAGVVFANVARLDDGADPNGIDASLDLQSFGDGDVNVYVLQGAFANAGAARNAIAEARVAQQGGEATDEDDAGFFVYFNQDQGRARLFAVEDLDQVGGSIQQVANLGDAVPLADGETNADSLARLEALAQLETFTADEFTFETDANDLLIG